jgi:hypothetical protein
MSDNAALQEIRANPVPHLAVKPQAPGIETNLTNSIRRRETMRELGEFSFKITSLIFTAGIVQVNCEGQAPDGMVALTLSCTPDKSGRYTTYGTNYLNNGDIITTKGTGSFESSGIHQWRTQADVICSDGRTLHTEGEMKLASRTWNGKVFEKQRGESITD